jgi:hypothetical protein
MQEGRSAFLYIWDHWFAFPRYKDQVKTKDVSYRDQVCETKDVVAF